MLFLGIAVFSSAQTAHDTLPSKVTLSQCRIYAINNHSLIKQSVLDEQITRKDIRIALSGWYPQLEFDAKMQHYLQVPQATYPNLLNPSAPAISLPAAADNTSAGVFSASQTLYSNDLFYSVRTSKELRNQASENTVNSKISIYVDVTKAFFDVLLTEQQLDVLAEDILRLKRNYKDAYSLYKNGLTDKIDYQRTEISLNNIQAQRRTTEQILKAKYAVLKQLMGVVPDKQLTVTFDSSKYENEIQIDTTSVLDFNKRIEYQLMQTKLKLQNSQISYYNWSFLPTFSAFYQNSPAYSSDQFSALYSKSNPTSLFGLRLNLPIFQGMNRIENLNKAKLQYNRLELGIDYLKSMINTEYTEALSGYSGNLNELKIAKNNISLARDIFNTVKLQYTKGIKAYLEVIVSETDLRTAELNYLNILFRVLSSKVDLEKALGIIKID